MRKHTYYRKHTRELEKRENYVLHAAKLSGFLKKKNKNIDIYFALL